MDGKSDDQVDQDRGGYADQVNRSGMGNALHSQREKEHKEQKTGGDGSCGNQFIPVVFGNNGNDMFVFLFCKAGCNK